MKANTGNQVMPVVIDLINSDPRNGADRARHPEKAHRPDQPVARKPEWIP